MQILWYALLIHGNSVRKSHKPSTSLKCFQICFDDDEDDNQGQGLEFFSI